MVESIRLGPNNSLSPLTNELDPPDHVTVPLYATPAAAAFAKSRVAARHVRRTRPHTTPANTRVQFQFAPVFSACLLACLPAPALPGIYFSRFLKRDQPSPTHLSHPSPPSTRVAKKDGQTGAPDPPPPLSPPPRVPHTCSNVCNRSGSPLLVRDPCRSCGPTTTPTHGRHHGAQAGYVGVCAIWAGYFEVGGLRRSSSSSSSSSLLRDGMVWDGMEG